jgi:hypothetical protein
MGKKVPTQLPVILSRFVDKMVTAGNPLEKQLYKNEWLRYLESSQPRFLARVQACPSNVKCENPLFQMQLAT